MPRTLSYEAAYPNAAIPVPAIYAGGRYFATASVDMSQVGYSRTVEMNPLLKLTKRITAFVKSADSRRQFHVES